MEGDKFMRVLAPMGWTFLLALLPVLAGIGVNVPSEAPSAETRYHAPAPFLTGYHTWIGGLLAGVGIHVIGGTLALGKLKGTDSPEAERQRIGRMLKLIWAGMLLGLLVLWGAGSLAVDVQEAVARASRTPL